MPPLALALAILAATAAAAPAQPAAEPPPALVLSLNTLAPQGDGCRLTFVATNGTGAEIAALAVETVLFDRGGRVAQFTLFDFGALPEGRRRVRQFDVPGLACAELGQVLLNGVARCDGPGEAACAAALRPESMVEGVEAAG